jgi:hypothetical protein
MPSKPRDTRLTRELAAARLPSGSGSVAVERIEVKKTGREEIRFSRWEGARMMPRPLALSEDELLPLLEAGLREGVFSEALVSGLRRALSGSSASPASPARPQVAEPTAAGDMGRIERHFHELIRSRAGDRLGPLGSSLPRLTPTSGTEDEPAWFPVEGIDGGFKYWWDPSAPGLRLMSESWSRQAAGSGQLHEVTPAGARLLAEGFI